METNEVPLGHRPVESEFLWPDSQPSCVNSVPLASSTLVSLLEYWKDVEFIGGGLLLCLASGREAKNRLEERRDD